jgi:Ca2+-binding RTX toxin-like protein
MFDLFGLESLESRKLLSGASISHGVLRVYGDNDNHNIITVQNSTDGKSVDVSVSWVTPNHVKKNFSAEFPDTLKFSKIDIYGGIRGDTVNVGQANGVFAYKTRVMAGRGNDTITTGSEADVIYAGKGNDVIKAGGGADLVYGGDGNDNIGGGNGNDTLWGGHGADYIFGNDGNDKLGGVLGANTLIGGAGNDTFVVKSLKDNPINDYNPAQDVLKTRGVDQAGDMDAPPGM